jgi:hypothetical protein
VFRKVDLFPSSGEGETPTLFRPLERANLQFPKRCVFYFLEYQKVDRVQKPCNSECYTPSSEPFNNLRVERSLPLSRVEAGSNTSTVALRVIGSDEKGPSSAWGYNWVTLFLGDINTGAWRLRWRGPAAVVNDRPIVSSERMLHKDYNRKCSVGK